MVATIKRCLLVSGVLVGAACGGGCAGEGGASMAQTESLTWDSSRYQVQTFTVADETVSVRAYEQVVYVAHPVDKAYQAMNVYIPEAYFHHQRIGEFTADTAPIFMPNQVGGYMPARPGSPADRSGPPIGAAPGQGGKPIAGGPGAPENTPGRPTHVAPLESAIAVALSKGYIVASPGARGRTNVDDQGHFTGKAPAAIVDLKAAVRYLRFNDPLMPGDAEKIISNGTSAGGALSALLGASGNSNDYEPYLTALGAAPARDDIFAVSAYCPITDLEHADAAYEWLFGGVDDYQKMDMSMLDYHVQRQTVSGTLSSSERETSQALKAQFPEYLNGLHLRDPKGQPLSLDADASGSFKAYVKSLVIASAQQALNSGQDLSTLDWLRISDGRVTGLDLDAYVRYVGRHKTPPAFDALDLSSGENQLFGTGTVDKQHFTEYAHRHSVLKGARQADVHTVKMMNALNYIASQGADTSRHWRVRHGTKDADTSLAIPVILATKLRNAGIDVDLQLPWDRPHSGDYDLDELFEWMAGVTAAVH